MINEIKFDDYRKFYHLKVRYFELFKKDNISKNEEEVTIAQVNIKFAIEDINKLIKKYNLKEFKVGDLYELIVKSYILMGAFDLITKRLEIFKNKNDYNELYGTEGNPERDAIDYFRAIRSLITEHPLETTSKSFDRFGFKKGILLEDIMDKNSITFSSYDYKDSDFY
ncbi:MAG: hypothetical protein FWF50_06040 [Defluviitaleaceae bacterium]|nr:hypothetical protein [Defluviitaleaceae bacterium]